MGNVYRKQKYRPIPEGAEIVSKGSGQIARWRDRHGKTKSAEVKTVSSGELRIVQLAATWTARYRDGAGIVRDESTGCRDKQSAQSVLRDLERRAELVRSNVITAEQDAIADHQQTPLTQHFDDYVTHLQAKACSPVRIANMRSQFDRVCRDCGFQRLADFDGDQVTRWLVDRQREGMGAATRNGYRETLIMFANWCVKQPRPRLTANPFRSVPKESVRTDRRRQRRALTVDELQRLLQAASVRPLREARTIRRGPRKGMLEAALTVETEQELTRLGRERALIYKTLVLTGLRLNELATLQRSDVHLSGSVSFLELRAENEKNRQGSTIPLRDDLAGELKSWMEDRQADPSPIISLSSQATDDFLFQVPRDLAKILNRDLEAAGIPKRDERGRSVDVHALRHTFGTLLSQGGVAPRVAQEAMRHSDIKLTLQTYVDPKLLNVRAALDVLPQLRLDGAPESQRATGTDPAGVPDGALKPVRRGQKQSNADNLGSRGEKSDWHTGMSVMSIADKRKDQPSTEDNRSSRIGTTAAALNHGQRCGTRTRRRFSARGRGICRNWRRSRTRWRKSRYTRR